MLCLSGFELYSRWVPLKELYPQKENPQHKKGCSHIQPAACARPYLSKRKEKELT